MPLSKHIMLFIFTCSWLRRRDLYHHITFSSKVRVRVLGTVWLQRFCMRGQIESVLTSGYWFTREDKLLV